MTLEFQEDATPASAATEVPTATEGHGHGAHGYISEKEA